jgi:hypothetical protein
MVQVTPSARKRKIQIHTFIWNYTYIIDIKAIQGFRPWKWRKLKMLYYGPWTRVIWKIDTNISVKPTASILLSPIALGITFF